MVLAARALQVEYSSVLDVLSKKTTNSTIKDILSYPLDLDHQGSPAKEEQFCNYDILCLDPLAPRPANSE